MIVSIINELEANMVFRQMGNFGRRVYDYYRNNDIANTTVNTVGIYAGGKLLGNEVSAVTGHQDLDTTIDMLAPVAAAIYADRRLRDIVDSQVARDLLQIALAGAVGWDMTDEIMDYRGTTQALDMLRNGMGQIHRYIDQFVQSGSPEVSGAVLGASGSALWQIIDGFRRRNQE